MESALERNETKCLFSKGSSLSIYNQKTLREIMIVWQSWCGGCRSRHAKSPRTVTSTAWQPETRVFTRAKAVLAPKRWRSAFDAVAQNPISCPTLKLYLIQLAARQDFCKSVPHCLCLADEDDSMLICRRVFTWFITIKASLPFLSLPIKHWIKVPFVELRVKNRIPP